MSTAPVTEPSSDQSMEQFQSVSAGRLRVGSTLRISIYDQRDVLLLAPGATITSSFLQKLQNRNISQVKVHESELARVYAGQPLGTAKTVPDNREGHFVDMENVASTRLDEEIRRGCYLGLPPQGEAFSHELNTHGIRQYSEEDMAAYIQNREESIRQVESVYNALAGGQGLDVDQLSQLAEEALADLAGDCDLFAGLSINPYSDRYPVRHCVHTCMLAMSIGTQLGLDRITLKELATGCLIHDAGMLQIDDRVYNCGQRLDEIQFLEITKHPILVFDMMKSMAQVPNRSAFIAYQIHERCNGSGYPRKRDGKGIHFLSKIAAVADAYIGLVSPRPHRPGMLPYHAIEKLIRDTQQGMFDPKAVRALLHTVSLFPIGSLVQLDDGRVGRVFRSNAEVYHRPVLEVWEKGHHHEKPEIVNLAEEPERRVVAPLAELGPTVAETEIADNWE